MFFIGRKRPPRLGVKLSLTGSNGAVSVRCRPRAARLVSALSICNERASPRSKCGASTITDVALSRPRMISSRIAALTPCEMP